MRVASRFSQWLRRFVARHLYVYLAGICGVVVLLAVIFGRRELARALEAFDLRFAAVVLALTLLNYSLRFVKWHLLLRDCGISVPLGDNLRLYFACFSMVVTPGRLGELYKMVFLRRLHGVPSHRSISPLIMERITDALAVLTLVTVQPFHGGLRVAAVVVSGLVLVLLGALLTRRAWQRLLRRIGGRIPGLRQRTEALEEALDDHAELLRPRSFAVSLGLSILGWWAECWGLFFVLMGLGAPIGVGDATWSYALSTLLGNLTFLPGGLGGTEVSLVALLGRLGVPTDLGVGATALIRAATLWFAVALGLTVSWLARRRLHWDAVRRESAEGEEIADGETAGS